MTISDKTFKLANKIGFDLKPCICGLGKQCMCREAKPIQAYFQKWLRESKFIDVLPYHQFSQQENTPVLYAVCVTSSINNVDDTAYSNYSFGRLFNKYEEALEFGFEKAIEIILNKKIIVK